MLLDSEFSSFFQFLQWDDKLPEDRLPREPESDETDYGYQEELEPSEQKDNEEESKMRKYGVTETKEQEQEREGWKQKAFEAGYDPNTGEPVAEPEPTPEPVAEPETVAEPEPDRKSVV